MSDLDDMLGGFEEPTYQETEKKGAPKLDDADLAGLLGDEPEVWTGNEQKRGAPVLDASQVALDEPEQAWQEQKPSGVQAQPVLDASALLGSEPEAYDPVAEFCNRLQFDDNLRQAFVNLDAEKQMQVVNMRAQQLGIPAPIIPNELRPKTASPADTAEEEVQLEEAPKTEEYVPKFKDEDLERAKEEAKKPRKYEPPPMELTEEKKQENRRLMAQMREERERAQAKKGFTQLIVLTIIGIISGVTFCLFFSDMFGLGNKLEADGISGLSGTIKAYAGYVGAAIIIVSLALAAPFPASKSLCKLLDIVGILMLLAGGLPLLIQTENGIISGVLFGVSLLTCGYSAVTLITSENISMYNKYGNS